MHIRTCMKKKPASIRQNYLKRLISRFKESSPVIQPYNRPGFQTNDRIIKKTKNKILQKFNASSFLFSRSEVQGARHCAPNTEFNIRLLQLWHTDLLNINYMCMVGNCWDYYNLYMYIYVFFYDKFS
jgi:hypothetical protein